MCLCSLCVWMCGYIIFIKFEYFSSNIFFCVVSWTPLHNLWDSFLLLFTPSLVVCPAQLMRSLESLEYSRYDGVSLLFSIYLSVCLFVYLSPLSLSQSSSLWPWNKSAAILWGHSGEPKNPMLEERASVECTCACNLAPALDTHLRQHHGQDEGDCLS